MLKQTDYCAPTTREGRDALRSETRLAWDGADPWGSALSVGFGTCEVLHFTGGDVPAEVDYSPGMGGLDEESYPDAMYLELLDTGVVSHADLAYWARVISRYLGLAPEDQKY
jgi:hypothetical protein